jgi:hypothetical protein
MASCAEDGASGAWQVLLGGTTDSGGHGNKDRAPMRSGFEA